MPETEAINLISQCCSASNWQRFMVSRRPFESTDACLVGASEVWSAMGEMDWLEAFDGHPKIGDPDSLKKKYQSTHSIASGEQSSVESASDDIIAALAKANQAYLEKLGFIFIICASGKSAEEMLQSIHMRIKNNRDDELKIAAAEQLKITLIRLNNMIEK